jgi:hypothetical protein
LLRPSTRLLLSAIALVGVLVFQAGLAAWFQLDDFMWLSIARAASTRGWWATLLTNTVHGTWRPLTEPLFFTILWKSFQLNALPYRLVAFATFVADVVLVGLTASRFGAADLEALLAAAVFAVAPQLVMPMSWTCSYNQLFAVAILTSALLVWRAYTHAGRARRYALVVALQVIGVLASETCVVFPVLAALFVVMYLDRSRWRLMFLRVAPLAAIAAAWSAIHLLHAHPAQAGPYRLELGVATLRALAQYWRWTVLPPLRWDGQAWPAIVAALSAVLLCGFIARQRNERRVIFFAAVYLVLLAPALLLPDHVTDYLLTTPLVGFALLLAAFATTLWRTGRPGRVAAALLMVSHLSVSAWASQLGSRWWSGHRAAIEPVIVGVAALREHSPRVPIRLYDLDQDFLQFGAAADPFRFLGLEPTCVETPPGTAAPPMTPRIRCGPADPAALRVSVRSLLRRK